MQPTRRLTVEEWNILQQLSSKAKMDWFWLITDNDGNDYIKDLENDKMISLKTGILMLDDGLTDLADYDLSPRQKEIYHDLIRKVLEGKYGK